MWIVSDFTASTGRFPMDRRAYSYVLRSDGRSPTVVFIVLSRIVVTSASLRHSHVSIGNSGPKFSVSASSSASTASADIESYAREGERDAKAY